MCVLGGAGGVGQPLSLLLACDPNVGELIIFDIYSSHVPAEGVAADLAHLDRKCKVTGRSMGRRERTIEALGPSLTGCHLVVVAAGTARRPGESINDLFKNNAGIAQEIIEACAEHCPDAVVVVITNPVSSLVPAMCQFYKKQRLNPKKIVGVVTCDVARANKFLAEVTGSDPEQVEVPIGVGAGTTILPLFSQATGVRKITEEEIPTLDKLMDDAGADVVLAKKGHGSVTLSMAHAGARLGKAVLAGLNGTPATECAFVNSNRVIKGLDYISTRVTFGKAGIEYVHPLGRLSKHEEERKATIVPKLKREIQVGLDFATAADFLV